MAFIVPVPVIRINGRRNKARSVRPAPADKISDTFSYFCIDPLTRCEGGSASPEDDAIAEGATIRAKPLSQRVDDNASTLGHSL
jgi:hypothetical protein